MHWIWNCVMSIYRKKNKRINSVSTSQARIFEINDCKPSTKNCSIDRAVLNFIFFFRRRKRRNFLNLSLRKISTTCRIQSVSILIYLSYSMNKLWLNESWNTYSPRNKVNIFLGEASPILCCNEWQIYLLGWENRFSLEKYYKPK